MNLYVSSTVFSVSFEYLDPFAFTLPDVPLAKIEADNEGFVQELYLTDVRDVFALRDAIDEFINNNHLKR